MLVKIKSVAFFGLDVLDVDVEVNISSRGLPSFDIVGLPNKSIDESRHRIKSAFQNSGIDFPNKKITVNLAPADVRKEGSFYDLPIAVGIFCALNNIEVSDKYLFFGELSLDGDLRYTKGVFLATLHSQEKAMDVVFVPESSCYETRSFTTLKIFGAKNLSDIFKYLRGKGSDVMYMKHYDKTEHDTKGKLEETLGLNSIVGQEQAKRALIISAAGGHHLFMMGPPGVGKTILANAASFLMPDLSKSESIEVTKIYSLSGKLPEGFSLITQRPFRNPHHTISFAGMVGGGHVPVPGEITLAHRGVLFLDEFCEYPRQVLEVLRQPLEVGSITISRSSGSVVFPSKFTLIAAANPCKCGYYGDEGNRCICTAGDIRSYQSKLSGPVMDRIDLFVFLKNISESLIKKYLDTKDRSLDNPDTKRELVLKARELQQARYCEEGIVCNGEMNNSQVKKYCRLTQGASDVFMRASKVLQLSPRAIFRVLKVSRTIADLDGSDDINEAHLSEAVGFRKQAEARASF